MVIMGFFGDIGVRPAGLNSWGGPIPVADGREEVEESEKPSEELGAVRSSCEGRLCEDMEPWYGCLVAGASIRLRKDLGGSLRWGKRVWKGEDKGAEWPVEVPDHVGPECVVRLESEWGCEQVLPDLGGRGGGSGEQKPRAWRRVAIKHKRRRSPKPASPVRVSTYEASPLSRTRGRPSAKKFGISSRSSTPSPRQSLPRHPPSGSALNARKVNTARMSATLPPPIMWVGDGLRLRGGRHGTVGEQLRVRREEAHAEHDVSKMQLQCKVGWSAMVQRGEEEAKQARRGEERISKRAACKMASHMVSQSTKSAPTGGAASTSAGAEPTLPQLACSGIASPTTHNDTHLPTLLGPAHPVHPIPVHTVVARPRRTYSMCVRVPTVAVARGVFVDVGVRVGNVIGMGTSINVSHHVVFVAVRLRTCFPP
ncbi:hypothetical protein JB92DRAFT_2833722 [Gautieria morchelliformis]|nr:hypothetical protein JB92DRAFT_2833722 [Gautieria morchelliformis]